MAKNKKKKQHRFWWFVVKLQVFCLCVVATALGVFKKRCDRDCI